MILVKSLIPDSCFQQCDMCHSYQYVSLCFYRPLVFVDDQYLYYSKSFLNTLLFLSVIHGAFGALMTFPEYQCLVTYNFLYIFIINIQYHVLEQPKKLTLYRLSIEVCNNRFCWSVCHILFILLNMVGHKKIADIYMSSLLTA